MNKFSCSLCIYSAPTYAKLCHHVISRHKNDSNFVVHCQAPNCLYSTKNWSTFRVHVSRMHSVTYEDSVTCAENVSELADRRNPTALQIILSCDDLEISNPLGAHVKKHKVCMFYFSLGNIPPQFRSQLSAIQLIGVAKSNHLKTKEYLLKFLNDFITTVTLLRTQGISMVVRNKATTVFGDLVLCPCDTLAAQWLGGFKEGVSFALKGCRTCTASASEMKTKFDPSHFHERSVEQHLRRCNTLDSMKESKNKKFWSKMWAKSKFGLEGVTNCAVVLESDGALVDDDDVLQGCKLDVLMLLKPSQQWQPSAVAALPIGESDDNGTSNAIELSTSENSIGIDQFVTPSKIMLSNIPLPDFSTYVKTALMNGNSKVVWPKMIEEMAHFYYDVVGGDNVRNQTAYLTIGKQIVQMYPSVERDGTKPWTLLTRCLSQRIRTLRFSREQKSLQSYESSSQSSIESSPRSSGRQTIYPGFTDNRT